MDFARKILVKYGWKDGDGLGKNNDGIAKPLRATLKFDNAGLGADQAASDFNNHWWERVFNDAASNVDVKHDGESIKMALVNSEDGVEISTKGYSVKKLKRAKKCRSSTTTHSSSNYNNFLQAATLTQGEGEVLSPNRIDVTDIEVKKVRVLTDEELFNACGGRTAHKGARHGLKLSGKLARLEQQEKELLAKMLGKQNCKDEVLGKEIRTKKNEIDCDIENPTKDDMVAEKRRKKKRKNLSADTVEKEQQEFENRVKNKKKKYKITPEDITVDEQSTEGKDKNNDVNASEIVINDKNVKFLKITKGKEMQSMVNVDGEDNDKKHKTKKHKKSKKNLKNNKEE